MHDKYNIESILKEWQGHLNKIKWQGHFNKITCVK